MRVSNEVLAVLSAARVEGPKLFLVGTLERKMYEQTNKVLEAAGGKWNRSAKAHIFDADAAERIDQIIVTGDIVIPKDEFEFFATPDVLVRGMLDRADMRAGQLVLEPNAGLGAIALMAAAYANVTVDCYELMDANFQHLRKYAGGTLGVVQQADFLKVEPMPVYDRVLMNPPFSRQQDIKHITHAFAFLKPGGRLVGIASAGVAFRQDKRASDFRELVEHCDGTIEPNPEGSFKASGTGVNTVLVTLNA